MGFLDSLFKTDSVSDIRRAMDAAIDDNYENQNGLRNCEEFSLPETEIEGETTEQTLFDSEADDVTVSFSLAENLMEIDSGAMEIPLCYTLSGNGEVAPNIYFANIVLNEDKSARKNEIEYDVKDSDVFVKRYEYAVNGHNFTEYTFYLNEKDKEINLPYFLTLDCPESCEDEYVQTATKCFDLLAYTLSIGSL